ELHIQIVQKSRQAPLFLVAPQPPCKGPHDGLRGQAVVDHPLVPDVLPEQRKRFIPRHGHCSAFLVIAASVHVDFLMKFIMASPYRTPAATPFGATASCRCRSPADRVTSRAATFSSSHFLRFVPGMGMMSSPRESTQ